MLKPPETKRGRRQTLFSAHFEALRLLLRDYLIHIRIIYQKLNSMKTETAMQFERDLINRGGHIFERVLTAKGDKMIYYREPGSYPTDVQTKVFTTRKKLL